MQYAPFLLTIFLPAILADRGNSPETEPTVCNSEPTAANSTSEVTPIPTQPPSCHHAADPSGGMGLCPEVGAEGWCDCGSDGNYPNLEGDGGVCDYTSLPATTLSLSSTNCAEPTSVPVQKRSQPTYTGIADRRRASRLSKRQGSVQFSNCGNAAPKFWQDAGFDTQEAVLQQAYSDAVTLAKAAQNVDANNAGFTHYFGGTKTDVQHDHFLKMMQAIADDTTHFSIKFECSAENTPSCGPNSVMVTDATSGGTNDVKTIEVCERFWSAASTKYLLYNSEKTTPTPPYRPNDNTAQGWCRKSTVGGDSNISARVNQYFSTAGHSILHELTHLDSLAAAAGLEADGGDQGRHGTMDVQTTCELKGAREWLQKYIANDKETSPDYSAESYAAAASEIYFMELCGFSQIRPVVN
ncbi:hypothetical protein Q7P37_000647 [Cladosporium fusiforme]